MTNSNNQKQNVKMNKTIIYVIAAIAVVIGIAISIPAYNSYQDDKAKQEHKERMKDLTSTEGLTAEDLFQ